jgi:hypothetical protein
MSQRIPQSMQCRGSSSSNDIEGSSSEDVVEERPLEEILEILEERPLSVRTEINKVVIDDVVAIPSGLAKDLGGFSFFI